jgi:hypothetical protein
LLLLIRIVRTWAIVDQKQSYIILAIVSGEWIFFGTYAAFCIRLIVPWNLDCPIPDLESKYYFDVKHWAIDLQTRFPRSQSAADKWGFLPLLRSG